MLYIIRIYQILLVKIFEQVEIKECMYNQKLSVNFYIHFVPLYFEKCENKASSEKILFYHLNSSLHYQRINCSIPVQYL